MKKMRVGIALRLWTDDSGAIISAELVLVLTIAVLSMIVGLSSLSNSLNAELKDLAEAFGALSQTFAFNGIAGCNASVSGSSFNDTPDTEACDCQPLVIRTDHFHVQPKCE